MPEADYGRSTFWLTALTIDPLFCGVTRDDIIDALEKENIDARPVWKPMHRQPLYRGNRFFARREDEDIAYSLFQKGLCLPSGSSLQLEQQQQVIDTLLRVLKS